MLRRLIVGNPIILGNLLRALLGVGTVVGLGFTDAQSDAIVAAVLANLAAFAAITVKERAVVSPTQKVADYLGKPIEVVDTVLRQVKL